MKAGDVYLRRGSRAKDPVKAHGFEALLDLFKGLLANNDIAADIQQDAC